MALQFGLCTDQNLSWSDTVERWQYFEQLGFDSLWDCDHYQQPSRPNGPYFEGWTLLVVDLLLRQDVTTFAGEHYQLKEAPFRPSPVQKPRPPLTLGAHRSKMLRIAAEYADRWNSHGTVDELGERNKILDEHCAAIGRDPKSIIRSLYGWSSLMPADPWESVDAFQEVVGQYRGAGINEFIIDAPGPGQFPMLERIAQTVIPGLRSS
jgi:alkanesulfonate monooxygenase SsuD/methylene tetrahydromethanopterin reductase-like flavin-dependent oxidoreductase (luciferase family)